MIDIAELILDNPQWKRVLEDIEREHFERWKRSTSVEDREKIYNEMNGVREIGRKLNALVTEGKNARAKVSSAA